MKRKKLADTAISCKCKISGRNLEKFSKETIHLIIVKNNALDHQGKNKKEFHNITVFLYKF